MANAGYRYQKHVDESKTEKQVKMFSELSRSPSLCPIGGCEEMFFPSGLMSHFLNKHTVDPKLQLREAFDSQRSILMIDAQKCPIGINLCLGALAYAGYKGNPASVPAKRSISFQNVGMVSSYKHLSDHVPVLIMICRTTWATLSHHKDLPKILDGKHNKNLEIYIVWCVSSAMTEKLHVTMTVFDKLFSEARSGIRLVSDFVESQKIQDFVPMDVNHILLTKMDIDKLSDKENHCINMEIILHESPQLMDISKITP